MSGYYSTIPYEEPCPEVFVNAVDQSAVKKEPEGGSAPFKRKDEEEDCDTKPFETIILKEEDIGVSHFQSNESDPLAIKKEDGIENSIDFQIKQEDKVWAENGDAVSQVPNGDAYPSCSKNGSHSKSRDESVTSSAVKPFQCSHCKYTCSRKGHLKNHILTHTGDKPFLCSHCKFRCSWKESLKRHMLTHSGDKPFQCSYCKYRSPRKENLKRHMLTHSGDKPFQCFHCKYRCSEKGDLKSHMLTHSSDKPFQCSHCKYRCSRKGNLKNHILTHSGAKPFQCSHCKYRCSRKEILKNHILTHSGAKPFQYSDL